MDSVSMKKAVHVCKEVAPAVLRNNTHGILHVSSVACSNVFALNAPLADVQVMNIKPASCCKL